MDKNLEEINALVYKKCALEISDFKSESESKEYDACRFKLNGWYIISRTARVTPKKAGQFVTFWTRNENGTIEPLQEDHLIDFFIVNVRTKNLLGQFVFPKSVLLSQGIITTSKKEGKRAFRVYPSWDIVKSKQAEQTQKWQLNYFYQTGKQTDLKRVCELYKKQS